VNFHVLVMTSQENTTRIIGHLVQQPAITVSYCPNYQDFLAKIREQTFDLIFIDEFSEPRFDIPSLHTLHHLQPSAHIIIVRAPGPILKKTFPLDEEQYHYISYPAAPVEIQRYIENIQSRLPSLSNNSISESVPLTPPQFFAGNHPQINALKDLVECAAKSDLPILIHGESGTGKELIANSIHYHSLRYPFPFEKVSCSAFASGILERDLFGQTEIDKPFSSLKGRCELAHCGTIYLDNIDDTDAAFQAKLTRLIQEKTYERFQGNETLTEDVRLLATIRNDLQEEMQQNRFNRDLFYRLSVITIEAPPLRIIKEDIPLLVQHFLKKHSILQNRPLLEPTSSFLSTLMEYWWPGNVRELENVVERALMMSPKDKLDIDSLPKYLTKGVTRLHRVTYSFEDYPTSFKVAKKQFERDYITSELIKHSLVISHTAKAIGITRRNLQQKIKQLHIDMQELKEQLSPNNYTP
jgi:DNA-binding NtrC family response regulator